MQAHHIFPNALHLLFSPKQQGLLLLTDFFVQNTITDVLYSFVARIAKTIVTEVTDKTASVTLSVTPQVAII
ncbi:MAG: hypothetical protein IJZ92_03140 [Bacteroidaceae bacterium]|nr:hypothetical protein [Bacteroidaceae bacterium]